MIVQEYVQIDGQWQEIRKYYRFPVELPRTDSLRPGRQECPGCGQRFTAMLLREHECLGGREGYPRLSRVYLRTRLAHAPELIRAYIDSRGHPVTETDARS